MEQVHIPGAVISPPSSKTLMEKTRMAQGKVQDILEK